MAEGKLVFLRPADNTGRLVFNDDTSGPDAPSVEISIDAVFADDMASGTVQLLWDANVIRGERAEVRTHWQEADPVAARAATHWQPAQPIAARAATHWQQGEAASGRAQLRWQNSQALSGRAGVRWQDGAALRLAMLNRWQEAERLRAGMGVHWQDGQALRLAMAVRYQEAIRLRLAAATTWQDGSARSARVVHRASDAQPVRLGVSLHWQDARRPPIGISTVTPPVVPQPEPCYDPATLGRLEFTEPWANDGRLVFVCTRATQPELPAGIVIPVRSLYMTVNTIILRRVAGNIELPADSFQMSLDADSTTWSWSANVQGASLDLLAPESGEPVELEAVINGVAYRLASEDVSRTRRFGKSSLSVSGRGLSAELDAPYALTQNFGNPGAAFTAQQLALAALTINGAGIGWAVDWGLVDWLVPTGAWNHQGTHLSAVNAIAAAAGGYVQPHRTARTLRVLPRYPAAPWDWGAITPDFELPSAPVVVEGIKWVTRPAYNRVHIGDQAQGVLYEVTRGGTAGDVSAPMVVDPLVGHADAGRQRGISILGDTGQQASVSLSLPVLPETGLIVPGQFVRYVDGATTRLGLVRSSSLAWERPKLRQTLTLETHV